MGDETIELGRWASRLRFEDIPGDVLEAARNTIADGVAACVFGSRFPWSQAVVRYAQRGGPGPCTVLGPGAPRLPAAMAALANGALAHAFELDAGTRRGVGAHPFGTVFTAALPVAQDAGATGRGLLRAFVAGSEVMLRIGRATRRSNEHRGFHAPGTTGPFGAAVACGLLRGLDTTGVLDALGIAGSVASGLKQFAHSETGSTVKRLHFGRAAEGGVLAAGLAAEGFGGPHDVLEGRAGFLRVFCDDYDVSELTRGLDGSTFHMREIAMKRFGTHGTSQVPLQALLDLRAQTPFRPGDVDEIRIEAAHEAVEHHDNPAPADLMQAQYSVPFCVGLACVRDIRDPRSLDESALNDAEVRRMVARVRYVAVDGVDKKFCRMTIGLSGGRHLSRTLPDPGETWRPATRSETHEKYAILMRDLPRAHAEMIFERIQSLEDEPDLTWLTV